MRCIAETLLTHIKSLLKISLIFFDKDDTDHQHLNAFNEHVQNMLPDQIDIATSSSGDNLMFAYDNTT